jgi:predicted Fe-S protein YdhL (DUF1289 family)
MSDKNALAIPSPCVGFCRLDEASGLCVGCARSAAEIAAWKSAPSAVLEQVWSELPRRRERLGISLHRLGWDIDRIRSFVSESVRAGGGAWVFGVFGAVAEFCVGLGESCDVDDAGESFTACTPRGAIRFEISPQVRALGVTAVIGSVMKEVVVMAVPKGDIRRPVNHSLAALGPDREAIRPGEREDRLFDLGLGAKAAGFCVRVSAPDLARDLEDRIGQGWADLLSGLSGRIVSASPTRVVLTPIGRVEIYTPIPPPGGRSPDGPHTHLLPTQLAVGRETPPGLDLPDSLAPCAIFYPQAGPAEETPVPARAALRSSEIRSLCDSPIIRSDSTRSLS